MNRHLRAFIDAWKEESARRRAERSQRIEREFLPAALEIMDSPPRLLGRIVLWLIIAFTVGAVLWAVFGRVDVVAVSEGRLIPRTRLQAVEPLEAGVVRALLVREGERVAAGQPLVEFDRTFTDADADAARSELASALLQRARAAALLSWSDDVSAAEFDFDVLDARTAAAEQRVVAARIAEFEARLAALSDREAAAGSARAQAQARLDQINATLPLVRQQLEACSGLAAEGFALRLQVVELSERVATLHHQGRAEAEAVRQAEAEAAMLSQERKGLRESFRSQAALELSEAETVIATQTEVLEKAQARAALQTLSSPVDGVVNEIALTTIGEVAQPGELARLSPGMAATVEVKTGRRRIISFLLSPIARAVSEAGRER